MSYPPPHNCAHEYKYSCPKTQKSNPPAKSWSTRALRRFPRRAHRSRCVAFLHLLDPIHVPSTISTFFHDKFFLPQTITSHFYDQPLHASLHCDKIRRHNTLYLEFAAPVCETTPNAKRLRSLRRASTER